MLHFGLRCNRRTAAHLLTPRKAPLRRNPLVFFRASAGARLNPRCLMKRSWYKSLLLITVSAFVIPLWLTSCGGGKSSMANPFGAGTNALRTSKHVVMVMEENQGYSTVVGDTSAWPHLNGLFAKGALATNYYADAHPSIGNYFVLTTGQFVTLDDSSTTIENVDNIARRLLSNSVPFKVYAEGITQGYLGGDNGLYVIRHNPFALLSDVANNKQVAGQVLNPFSQFG